ncbi:hypothetical protein AV654_19745 [Paenibacillus elgii]|uniref:Integrase n=1 Tax=Paenibacillus elgii TaxID=189691 RepID=A0A163XP83_9BACL|nr:tyrosine-type recombinase/integrase [Paenibacillus elgii]KZE78211.1 hypothetical protein AV654_19745 [Paenibacillus elgii]
MEQVPIQNMEALFQGDTDRLSYWKEMFMNEEIRGFRSPDIEKKINMQLERFISFFFNKIGHEKVTAVTRREVQAWIDYMHSPNPDDPKLFAASTVNNHWAHLSLFMGWLHQEAPNLLPTDPTKGMKGAYMLPAPEARSYSAEQVVSLINICDRLERFHQLKGRRWRGLSAPLNKRARPKRDRAIFFILLATGIRRAMLINLNLDQLEPNDPARLRTSRSARLVNIHGKGRSLVTKVLSSDARKALADYLEFERPLDADPEMKALFLTGKDVGNRKSNGRMNVLQVNRILTQIGEWHDAEQMDEDRKISPLRPHDLRHTYAFYLSEKTNGNPYILQAELGHRNDQYIGVYTRSPSKYREKYHES